MSKDFRLDPVREATVEQQAKSEWDRMDATAREEFCSNYGTFSAYKKAVAGGGVRTFGGDSGVHININVPRGSRVVTGG